LPQARARVARVAGAGSLGGGRRCGQPHDEPLGRATLGIAVLREVRWRARSPRRSQAAGTLLVDRPLVVSLSPRHAMRAWRAQRRQVDLSGRTPRRALHSNVAAKRGFDTGMSELAGASAARVALCASTSELSPRPARARWGQSTRPLPRAAPPSAPMGPASVSQLGVTTPPSSQAWRQTPSRTFWILTRSMSSRTLRGDGLAPSSRSSVSSASRAPRPGDGLAHPGRL